MRFDAIVHAPTLRVGAKLNIAVTDQPPDGIACPLDAGSEIRLRFGVCCPDHACGTIARRPDSDSERAVLTIGSHSWMIGKAVGGIRDPGLFSETWIVIAPVEPT